MKSNTVFFRSVYYIWILLLSSIAFTGQQPANAQTTRKIKVYVDVSCDEKNTETLIKSWTKRELRNLLDVNIVGAVDAEMMLILFAREPIYEKTGKKTGAIIISYTFLHRVPTSPDISPHFYFPDIGLATGDKDEDLENFCKSIVANFDTTKLESVRIARKVTHDILREHFPESN